MSEEAKPPPPPLAPDILHEAAAIVGGTRAATHGAAESSFAAIAADWTVYLASRRVPEGPIRPHDVAHMMVRLKQQRAEWGHFIRDNAVDAAGYSALALCLWRSDQ